MKDGRHVLAVAPVTVERTAGRCRVAADLGGVPAWFESDDAALAPAAKVRALIRRSRFPERPDVRLRRAIVRRVVGRTRRAGG